MNRAEKQAEVEKLATEFADIRNAFLVGYRGIKVNEVTELRAQVRQSGGSYRVIKNRLMTRAVAEAPLGKLSDGMTGPTAVVWSQDEPVALAKTLTQFAKTAPVLEFKGVLLDGEAIPVEQLDAIASLPTKEQLQGMLVGVLAAPLRNLVTVLSAPSRDFASVLKQKAEKG